MPEPSPDSEQGAAVDIDAVDREAERQGRIDHADLSPGRKVEEREKVRKDLDDEIDIGGRPEGHHE